MPESSTSFSQILNLLGELKVGYGMFVLLLFATRLYKGEIPFLINLLTIANVIILLVAVVSIADLGLVFIEAYESGYLSEQMTFYNRVLGNYRWAYLLMYFIQFLPLLFLMGKVRRGFLLPLILTLLPFPLIERYIIIFSSLMDDYLPATWTYYFAPFLAGLLSDFIAFCSLVAIGLLFQWLWNKSRVHEMFSGKPEA